MSKNSRLTAKMVALLVGVASLFVLGLTGCKGGGDDAPTNTKNSQYVGTGDTAADKVGQDRANAHRARLPHGGATQ